MQSARGTSGLVLFEDPNSANYAVAEMNGQPVEDQQLIVQLANRDRSNGAAPGPRGAHTPAGTNLWVGNLPLGFGEPELQGLMEPYGQITSLKLLKDRKTGATEGAGMVNFATVSDAAQAIASLDGQMIPESAKPLIVRYAAVKPSPMMAPMMGMGAGKSFGQGTNLWVGSLPPVYGEADISGLFCPFGTVVSCKVLKDKNSGMPEGAAMVNFSSPTEAAAAIHGLNGQALEFGAPPLIVRYASSRTTPAMPLPSGPVMAMGYPGPMHHHQGPMRPMMNGPSMATPNANLWVGNLPPTYTEVEVHALFQPYGHITSAKILRDRADRPAERAAMVNFTTAHQAANAMQSLSGVLLPNSPQPLIVKYSAKGFGAGGAPAPSGYPGTPMGYHQPMGGYQAPPMQMGYPAPAAPSGPSDNLWVGNVPLGYTEGDLHGIFGGYGTITSMVLLPPKKPGQKAAALVRFASVAEAAGALQALDGTPLDPSGPPILVKFSNKSQGQPSGLPKPFAPRFHPYNRF